MLAMDWSFAALVASVAIAFTTEASIGFGAMLLAVTLGATVYPIPTLLPVLVCLSVLMTSYIVVRHRAHVQWRLLGRQILPAMGFGGAAGYVLFVNASPALLKSLLGVFVLAVAGLELSRQLRGSVVVAASGISPLRFATTAVGAGVVHGMTATGGPVLVYAVGKLGLHKSDFRATLACVWLVLNATLAVVYAASGRLGADEATTVAALAPVVACSVVAGEWLHGRLDERSFRIGVLVLLAGAGVSLLV